MPDPDQFPDPFVDDELERDGGFPMTTICYPETEINSVTKRKGPEFISPIVSSGSVTEKNSNCFSPLGSAKDTDIYDIYLITGCSKMPNFEGLLEEAPVLADPAVVAHMMGRWSEPGFLTLDLPCRMARIVLRRLKAARAQGCYLPLAYRDGPMITAAEAAPIARHALTEWQMMPRYRHLTFGPMRFAGQRPFCWDFGVSCQEWLAEDRIPGVLYISIDKLDGHVWQEEEVDEIYEEPPYASPPPTHPSTQLVVWCPPCQL